MSTKPILILDDGESVRDVMGQFFWDERFEVCQASSKQEALRMVRENPFELVVIDLKIPCPDSLEVLRQIRQIQPDTVVLILTGYPYVETRPKA